jgi:uncharacterized membrane protein YidH (DUF202 family)
MKPSLLTTWISAVTLCVVTVFAGVLFMTDFYKSDLSRVAYFMSEVRPASGGNVSPFWQAVLLVLIAAIPASILTAMYKDYTKRNENKTKAVYYSIGVWVSTYVAAAILVMAIYT